MGRSLVDTRTFEGDADGAFPAGMRNLNGFSGEIRCIVEAGGEHNIHNPFGTIADARAEVVFAEDQYFIVPLLGLANNGDTIGGGLHYGTGVTGGAGVDGYRITILDESGTSSRILRFFKVVAGTATQMGADVITAWANGDTLEVEAVTSGGTTTLVAYNSGVQVTTRTDSSSLITGGCPGVSMASFADLVRIPIAYFGNVTSDSIYAQACL